MSPLRWSAALASCGGVLLASLALAGPGGAAPSPVLIVDPTAGPAGTAIHVGTDLANGCGSQEGGGIYVTLVQDGQAEVVVVQASTSTGLDPSSWAWSVVLPVPRDAAPGGYAVFARCLLPGGNGFDYTPVAFQVVAPAAATTTTAPDPGPASTTLTPAPPTTAVAPVPPVAGAVRGTPAFTG